MADTNCRIVQALYEKEYEKHIRFEPRFAAGDYVFLSPLANSIRYRSHGSRRIFRAPAPPHRNTSGYQRETQGLRDRPKRNSEHCIYQQTNHGRQIKSTKHGCHIRFKEVYRRQPFTAGVNLSRKELFRRVENCPPWKQIYRDILHCSMVGLRTPDDTVKPGGHIRHDFQEAYWLRLRKRSHTVNYKRQKRGPNRRRVLCKRKTRKIKNPKSTTTTNPCHLPRLCRQSKPSA